MVNKNAGKLGNSGKTTRRDDVREAAEEEEDEKGGQIEEEVFEELDIAAHDIVAGGGDVRGPKSEDSYGGDGFMSEEEQPRGGVQKVEKQPNRETGAGGGYVPGLNGGPLGVGAGISPAIMGEKREAGEAEEKPRGVFAKPSFMMKKKR